MMDGKVSKSTLQAVENLKPQEDEELTNLLSGFPQSFVRIGSKKTVVPQSYLAKAEEIYNFPVRNDDIFIVTYPKSGTTLTQELVWLICNNLDYATAQQNVLGMRFPFLELSAMMPADNSMFKKTQIPEVKKTLIPVTVDDVKNLPSPRFIKSHLPFSILPPSLLDTTKVVYVARDPRDVAVSFYYHNRLMKMLSPDKEFKPFWNSFVKDLMIMSPFFDHILEAWEQKDHPNMLFMFYEDMIKDMPRTIRLVANFFGREMSDDEVERLANHLMFDNFKKNKSVNFESMQKSGVFTSDGAFIRKGKSGGWKEYFDDAMATQAEEWIMKNIRGTDFRFPE